MNTLLIDQLRAMLRSRGRATSAEMQAATGMSQPTVSRALHALVAAGEVLRTGGGRSQAYLMPRRIEGTGSAPAIPIFRINSVGQASPFGSIVPTTRGFWVEERTAPAQMHDGLPWFIADMQPQGFLGRAFASKHRNDLRLAPNPAHWNEDDILRSLCQYGHDLPGNLIVGEQAFERYLTQPLAPPVAEADYARLADAAMQGEVPGSSAGGEQPKFCARRAHDGISVLVKFSPPGTSAAEVRWKDLLVCEHIALEVLRQANIPAAQSRLLYGGGRTMLEVERFDRTDRGRIGMVSLLAFDSEYIGNMDNWGRTADRAASRRLLPQPDTEMLRLLEAYGVLIRNTDRHYGNISLLVDEHGKWRLAPAYDMLPMGYAPVAAEVLARPAANPGPMAPTAETLGVWNKARDLASLFWREAAEHEAISEEFRPVLRAQRDAMEGAPIEVAADPDDDEASHLPGM